MKSLTCKDVSLLLPLYVENKTSEDETKSVEEHLKHCPNCIEKYISLKTVANKVKSSFENVSLLSYESNEHFFRNNICAYIDNELDKDDYLFFNRYVTANYEAKKELEEMYSFDEKLKESIEKNTSILKKDLSKSVISAVKNESPTYIYELYIKAAIFTCIFILLTTLAGYFSIPDNMSKISDFKTKLFANINLN